MRATPGGLTIFAGRCADRNARAMAGAEALGVSLEACTGLRAERIGAPRPPLLAAWDAELAAATPDLRRLARRLEGLLGAGASAITTLSRCAASIATLPVVARLRPDAAVVWFDAHGDSNTPQTSASGYLGGMVLSGAAGLWATGFGGELRLADVVLVGARDLDPAEQRLIEGGGPRLLAPGGDLEGRLAKALGGRPVYVHIDCDVLEPGLVPTEYAVPGGLTLSQLQQTCAVLAACEVVGLEIAEYEVEAGHPDRAAHPKALLDALSPLIAAVVDA